MYSWACTNYLKAIPFWDEDKITIMWVHMTRDLDTELVLNCLVVSLDSHFNWTQLEHLGSLGRDWTRWWLGEQTEVVKSFCLHNCSRLISASNDQLWWLSGMMPLASFPNFETDYIRSFHVKECIVVRIKGVDEVTIWRELWNIT